MAHKLNPEEDNPFIEIGRILHEESYQREKKEITIGNMKLDILKKGDTQTIIAEIKKTSRFEKAARMQLAFYLYRLKEMGIQAQGELLIPTEKKRIKIELNNEIEAEIREALLQIQQ